MKAYLLHQIDRLDQFFSKLSLRLGKQEPALLIWVFHVLFRDKEAIQANTVFPFEQLTINQLAEFIDCVQDHGHEFIQPSQLIKGLPAKGFYHLLTFDDGYFNNSWALPILERYQVPALFHIATHYTHTGKSFWWDAHFRARVQDNWRHEAIVKEQNELKKRNWCDIQTWLIEQFGEEVMRPIGDQDRPFRAAELAKFAQHPLVSLGNHTHNHAILTVSTEQDATDQISLAQQDLLEISGEWPLAIAYPNGNHSPRIGEMAQKLGLEIGLTGKREKHFLSQPVSHMHMGRVTMYGFRSIEGQLATYLADKSLKWRKAAE